MSVREVTHDRPGWPKKQHFTSFRITYFMMDNGSRFKTFNVEAHEDENPRDTFANRLLGSLPKKESFPAGTYIAVIQFGDGSGHVERVEVITEPTVKRSRIFS